jgi:uncharacterized membrane protein HdeD (DUF308 family)
MEQITERSFRHWWVFLLRGLLWIGLGIYMIAEPAASFAALGFIFGLILFLTGVFELVRVTRERTQTGRSWHLMLGIIDVVLGAVLMSHVATSMAILRIILGLWFVFRGFSLFSFAGHTSHSWLVYAGALMVFVFGLLVLFNPAFGDMTIILWTALAFIVTGIFNIYLGYLVKGE